MGVNQNLQLYTTVHEYAAGGIGLLLAQSYIVSISICSICDREKKNNCHKSHAKKGHQQFAFFYFHKNYLK